MKKFALAKNYAHVISTNKKIYFSVIFDQNKPLTERIVIGTLDGIQAILLNQSTEEVSYDCSSELGSLFNHLFTNTSKWIDISQDMDTALSFPPTILNEESHSYLHSHLSDENPLTHYISMLYYSNYFHYRNQMGIYTKKMRHEFLKKSEMICNSLKIDFDIFFPENFTAAPEVNEHAFNIHSDRISIVWPDPQQNVCCGMVHENIGAIIPFYIEQIKSKGLVLRRCAYCKKYFLAKNKTFDYCSEGCRNIMKLESKRKSDQKSRETFSDNEYRKGIRRIRNMINKHKTNDNYSTEFYQEIDDYFQAIKNEGKIKKKEVSTEYDAKKFKSWLLVEENKIYDMLNKLDLR